MLEAFELSKEVKLCDEVELCDDIKFNRVNRDFWTTDDGSGSLVPVCAPRTFADKAAGLGECFGKVSNLISRPLIIWLFITSLAAISSFSHLK